MIRIRIIILVLVALLVVGFTSQATPALGQGESKPAHRDTVARLAPPVRGDFPEPTVDGLVRLLAVRRAVIAMDDRWRVAQLQNDAALLDTLLADEWTTTWPGRMGFAGLIQSKAIFLGDVKSGERSYESIDDSEVRVRIEGDNAVLTGRTTSQGYYRDHRSQDTSAFIRTYTRRDGRWQMIASQSSAIEM